MHMLQVKAIFSNLMNNDLGSYIDPIWKAISSIVHNTVKLKDL